MCRISREPSGPKPREHVRSSARERRINKFAANHSTKRGREKERTARAREGDDFSCKSQSAARPDKGPIKRTAFLPLHAPRFMSFFHRVSLFLSLSLSTLFLLSHYSLSSSSTSFSRDPFLLPCISLFRVVAWSSLPSLPPSSGTVSLSFFVSFSLFLFLRLSPIYTEYLSFLHTFAIIIQTLMTSWKSTAVRRPQHYPSLIARRLCFFGSTR